MIRTNLDMGWTVAEAGSWNLPAERVDLPHDWSIHQKTRPDAPGAGGNGFFPGAALIYRKEIALPEKPCQALLELDGAYRNCEVAVNGNTVAQHAYGYTAFFADLTRYARFGEVNEIAITVNNSAMPNSRWYSGTGLYRHVDLLLLPDVAVRPWGIFPVTESLDSHLAVVRVEVAVQNRRACHAGPGVRVELVAPDGTIAAAAEKRIELAPDEEQTCFLRLAVEHPRVWSVDDPQLYQVKAILLEDGGVIDEAQVETGLRTVQVDPIRGFRLNGVPLKLKGGCVHHDLGPLGSAAFDQAEERRVRRMKEAGYNALRCAHNPPSRGLLAACDRLGMLVIDEAFDMWTVGKNINDYHLDFLQNWEKDIDAMVLRDRVHPCVVMWSIGNEIPERDGSSDGAAWARKLAERIRRWDVTRLITSAVNNLMLPDMDFSTPADEEDAKDPTVGFFNNLAVRTYNEVPLLERSAGYTAPLDVVGYNYLEYLYEKTLALHPDRILCGTESFPLNADKCWAYVMRYPQIIGDFTWTSWDYLGEAGLGRSFYQEPASADEPIPFGADYPWRTSYDADFDICGFERPQLAYRQIVWGSQKTYIASRDPRYHGQAEKICQWGWPLVHHHWSWPGCEGMPTTLEVYSPAEEVELLLNGASLGRKRAGADHRYKAEFTLTYQPGRLEAVSYIGGQPVSRDALETAGVPDHLALLPETDSLTGDGQGLCFIRVEVQDRMGRRVPTAEVPLAARVRGAAALQAFGSPRPDSIEVFTAGTFTSFEGRALAILRAGTEAGTAALEVTSPQLGQVRVELPVLARS